MFCRIPLTNFGFPHMYLLCFCPLLYLSYMHTCMLNVYAYICIHIYIHIHVYICMVVYIYRCVRIYCMYIYMCMARFVMLTPCNALARPRLLACHYFASFTTPVCSIISTSTRFLPPKGTKRSTKDTSCKISLAHNATGTHMNTYIRMNNKMIPHRQYIV